MWCFSLPLGRDGLGINGPDVPPGETVSGRGGQDFHAVTEGPMGFAVVSLDLALLGRHLRGRFGLAEAELPAVLKTRGRHPSAVAAAAAALQAIGQRLPAAAEPGAVARLQEKAAEPLLSALARPSAGQREPPRWQLARSIETLLRDRAEDPPGIRELCEGTDATERTLHLAFREAYGMAPVAYLRPIRLNAVAAGRSAPRRRPGAARQAAKRGSHRRIGFHPPGVPVHQATSDRDALRAWGCKGMAEG